MPTRGLYGLEKKLNRKRETMRYYIQEEYKEYVKGTRIVEVEAKSKKDLLDGDYEINEIVEELPYSWDEFEASEMITEIKMLGHGWTEIVKETIADA
jgi:hypothetical protein